MSDKLITLEEQGGPFQAVFQRILRMVPDRDKNDKSLQRLLAFRLKIDGETVLGVEFLDTGPGIRSEDLEQLFDPFFSTKPVGEGTGLGLSVSRNIVHLHRVFIDIRNRDSGGVSVLIILKLAKGEK